MNAEHGHLLIVDDNEMNRDMLSRRLTRRGYSVGLAENGQRALEMIDAEPFDLVLLDIMMPGIDGIEVLKRLRRTHTVADLPIIMVTAKGQSEDVVEALRLGANDYVTKPLDFPVVLARVQTQLSLKRLSQLKDEFLRIASHDLKNPLASMLGYISLLELDVVPGNTVTEELPETVQTIKNLTRTIQRIVEDFLDFQAMEDGQLTLTRRPTDLNAIACEVVQHSAAYATGKNIDLRSELEADLPQVNADRNRIAQVVENFVGNAIKFGPGGTTVVVRTRTDTETVVLEVSDSGPGLADGDFNKLFVKYARLSTKPTGGEKSSGLGLAICKQLIDLHGGRIGARNNPDRGATFWFSLPTG